jgi:hypothetical protein
MPSTAPTRGQNGISVYLVALTLLWPKMGWGSDDVAPLFSLGVDFSLFHFDYREFKDDGRQFNRESGYIPGMVLTLGRATEDWDILGKFSYHSAEIGYDGKTQTGTQILTSTNETLYDLSIQLGKQLFLTPEIMPVRLYGKIGYRQWERDIRSTPIATGLLETYQWGYASAGATLPVMQTSWGDIAFDARLTRMFNSSIDVSFRGLYDTVNLTLDNRIGFRVSLPISLPLQEGFQLHIDPFWEEWSFGKSNTENLTQNGSIVGTLFEPRSETRATGIMVGLKKKI